MENTVTTKAGNFKIVDCGKNFLVCSNDFDGTLDIHTKVHVEEGMKFMKQGTTKCFIVSNLADALHLIKIIGFLTD